MSRHPRCGSISGKIVKSLCALAALVSLARGTGYYGPDGYLDDGGKDVIGSPEFYWHEELRRLSREFHPKEKLITAEQAGDDRSANLMHVTKLADERDFADAIKTGRLKPADPAEAIRLHSVARGDIDNVISANTDADSDLTRNAAASVAAEPPSEFADYHKGALYYAQEKTDEARAAWKALLDRPAEERHYRTVWAAFMLGKLGQEDDPEAPKWFQRAREDAAQGFADSLGMAADSYGWEARSEWKQGHPEKAAPLYLTQLALGDNSALVSLKALIPDRSPTMGMLNFGPELEELEKQTPEEKTEREKSTAAALEKAARDPLLRRLVTAHILATSTTAPDMPGDAVSDRARSAHWLATIQRLKLGRVADAEYLGWIAYALGDYPAASRWLALGDPASAASAWLQAKLLWRAGKTAEAARSMAKAWQAVDAETESDISDRDSMYLMPSDMPSFSFHARAGGDLAAMHLGRGDFIQAMEMFLQGGLWSDAAYVAERVLTTEELQRFVAAQKPEPPPKVGEETASASYRLHYLLGRRLVREGRFDEASPYLPMGYQKVLQAYVEALKIGRDTSLPKMARAQAWFTAAWIARYDGMEIMGTEEAPDVFASQGAFPAPDLAKQRITGKYDENLSGEDKPKLKPIVLKATPEEVRRLKSQPIKPDLRYHYRYLAAEQAMEAAKLLPDESEALADVVNAAGTWVKDRDEKLGDRYYAVIEKRCAKTELGKQILAKHWFTDQNGDWSAEQEKSLQELHKQAGIEPAQ